MVGIHPHFINCKISIRGKQHLESTSRRMLINKSINIALKAETSETSRYTKQPQAIKVVKSE